MLFFPTTPLFSRHPNASLSLTSFFQLATAFTTTKQPAHKSLRTKKTLAKKQNQNRGIPGWIRMRTGNTIR